MSKSKCCGTCGLFCWKKECQEFRCKDKNERRKYKDVACNKYKQEVYRDYDAYTK